MTRRNEYSRHRNRRPAAYRPGAEALEARALLSVDGHDALVHLAGGQDIGTFPAISDAGGPGDGAPLPISGPAAAAPSAPQATYPLTAVPALNSLPGAAASLYLDFDGYFEADWSVFHPGTTPAFDQDGDPSTFSDAELANIRWIWALVAEDYAPFRINVTTVEPASFADGVAERVVIGGNGAWYGNAGGVGIYNSFTDPSFPNSVYVFPDRLNRDDRNVAEASSHEAGHGFGLFHQSIWSGDVKLNEYNPGDANRAPIMGSSTGAVRGLWWYGASAEKPDTIQDDMAVISRPANGFGYRADEAGDTPAAAAAVGAQQGASGVITTTDDRDYYRFSTGFSTISLAVAVPANNNLDARLELRDQSNNLIASSDPAGDFGAGLTVRLGAGTYYAVVASHGDYGDVGQYTLAVTPVRLQPSADYDGDGAADVAIYRPGTNLIAVRRSDGAGNLVVNVASASASGVTYTPSPGDYDGDGRTDFALYRSDLSAWSIQPSDLSRPARTVVFGPAGVQAVPVAGDFDGDGGTDYAAYRSDISTWYVMPSDTTKAPYPIAFGNRGVSNVPLPGDYNGDGRTDFAAYQPSNHTFYVQFSDANNAVPGATHQTLAVTIVPMVLFGATVPGPGSIPVVGDYDGDGITDYAVYEPTRSSWVIQPGDRSYAEYSQTFGPTGTGTRPVSADYDDDGKTDLTTFTPTTPTNNWAVRPSTGAAPYYVTFGATTDLPLPPVLRAQPAAGAAGAMALAGAGGSTAGGGTLAPASTLTLASTPTSNGSKGTPRGPRVVPGAARTARVVPQSATGPRPLGLG